MTRDEIIKLAQEAKLLDARAPGEILTFEILIERLVEFGGRCAAGEREACARICDGIARQPHNWMSAIEAVAYGDQGAKQCAHAIRARGE